MSDDASALRRQDLADLGERWTRALESSNVFDLDEVLDAFDALLDYIHAGEEPSVEGEKDGLLYRVEKKEGSS